MTLKTRNNIIVIALVFSAVVTILSIAAVVLVYLDSEDSELLQKSIPPFLYAVCSCVVGVSIQFSFRKTLSAEITLFLVFITLVSFDALKPGILLLHFFDKPVAWSVHLTRIIHLFRFAGLFCFVTAGLFASGLTAQRLTITLGLCFFIACTFAIIIPVDSSIREDNFLYRLGMHRDIQTAVIALEILGAVNYVTAALRNNEKAYLAATLGAGCAIVGRELLFFHHSLLTVVPGIGLFLFGTILYANKIHRIYLWK